VADSDFDYVDAGSFDPNHLTPDVESEPRFRGIRIVAPARVALSGKPDRDRSFARVMVVGGCHLDSDYLDLRERFLEHILLVAVDCRRHVARASRIELIPNALEHPREPALAPTPGRSAAVYFNLNLVRLLDLPEVEAEYVIYAMLGRYVSNVVRSLVA
jgi:hypothetical protein